MHEAARTTPDTARVRNLQLDVLPGTHSHEPTTPLLPPGIVIRGGRLNISGLSLAASLGAAALNATAAAAAPSSAASALANSSLGAGGAPAAAAAAFAARFAALNGSLTFATLGGLVVPVSASSVSGLLLPWLLAAPTAYFACMLLQKRDAHACFMRTLLNLS